MRATRLSSRLLLALGIGVAFGLLAFGGLASGQFGGFSLQLSDRLQPTGKADDRVLVVAIDQRAIATGGRWPWPRRLHAQIVRELREAGAKTIAYDILFGSATEDDDLLAEQIGAAGNVVLAAAGDLECDPAATVCEPESALTLPVGDIASEAATVGHVSITPDPDDVVRSLPLLVDDGTNFVPSLSLATYAEVENLTNESVTLRPNGVQLGDELIPTGKRALMEVAFAPELRIDAEEPPIISAADVLDGQVPTDRLEGKIVFVGATDPTLGDNSTTPAAKGVKMPGVLIHANAVNTMITGQFLRPAGDVRVALAAGALALVVGLATLVFPVSVAPLAAILALAGYAFWSVVQFDSGTVLDLIYPPLAIVLAFVTALGFRYFTELRGRRRVSALFSQYVPRGVADELIASGRVEDTIRGERLDVTALFCDLRGFTATSAQLEPTQVRDLLNIYYDECSQLVHKYGGTLLTYIGDEVFAAWGAPMPDAANASKAVACARAMQEANVALDARLAAEGLPSVTYGIGLHTGEVIAAHVGTELHRQYTLLGDTVNCASRLCTIAGRHEIAVSDETYQALDEKPPAETLPGVKLKGVGRDLIPHKLWPDELKDPTGQQRGKLEG